MKRPLSNEPEAPRRTTEREVVLRRFLDLAAVDQIWVFERVAEALSLTSPVPPELDRQLAMRAETLAALRHVQEHLGLERPPTVGEYNDVRVQLGISRSSTKIIRVWGRWRDAVAALAGERDRSTVADAPTAGRILVRAAPARSRSRGASVARVGSRIRFRD